MRDGSITRAEAAQLLIFAAEEAALARGHVIEVDGMRSAAIRPASLRTVEAEGNEKAAASLIRCTLFPHTMHNKE